MLIPHGFEGTYKVRLDGTKIRLFPWFSGYDPEDVIEGKVHSVGIAVVQVIDGEFRHLLIQHADRPGRPFDIPAGKVDPDDENPIMTALRELYEETRIETYPNCLTPLTYVLNGEKISLQYLVINPIHPLLINMLRVRTHEDRIYTRTPNTVESAEIAQLVWERLDPRKSLLNDSPHKKAYERYFLCLARKGFPVIGIET